MPNQLHIQVQCSRTQHTNHASNSTNPTNSQLHNMGNHTTITCLINREDEEAGAEDGGVDAEGEEEGDINTPQTTCISSNKEDTHNNSQEDTTTLECKVELVSTNSSVP